jgi:hypothetical protein|nr:MAG TPA_asm: hypothetical protein [Caudoviricetes sp.]
MKKEININKIDLKVFYAEEKDYKDINIILNALEEHNIILSWSINNEKEYEISYLNHNDKIFILDNIETLNEKLGFKMTSYKEKGFLTY